MLEHLRGLAVFATTVERGSFREAAKALGLSPSVVSHHVSELERRLDATLLYRTTRRLALTPAGERLYASAREVTAAAERGLDAVAGAGDDASGTLRVTAPGMLADVGFCADVAAFTKASPRVRLELSFSEGRRDLFREGLDLALRFGHLDDSTLRSRRLAEMPRVLVASPSYAAARPTPRTPKDLAAFELVRLAAMPPEVPLLPPRRKVPVVVRLPTRLVVDDARAIRALVLAGAGLASLPEVLVRGALAQGELLEVLPTHRLPSPGVFAVWPDATRRPGLTERFVAFVGPRLAALFTPPRAPPRS